MYTATGTGTCDRFTFYGKVGHSGRGFCATLFIHRWSYSINVYRQTDSDYRESIGFHQFR